MVVYRLSREDRANAQIADRNSRVLEAAITEALTHGFEWITRAQVADRARCARATVSNAYGTMSKLKQAVLQAACDREILEIVAQGLAVSHPIARNARPDVRERAAAHIA